MIVNTSFNVRGEPIVCTPEDAYRCFMRTNMDVLVLENFILEKTEQAPIVEDQGLARGIRARLALGRAQCGSSVSGECTSYRLPLRPA